MNGLRIFDYMYFYDSIMFNNVAMETNSEKKGQFCFEVNISCVPLLYTDYQYNVWLHINCLLCTDTFNIGIIEELLKKCLN